MALELAGHSLYFFGWSKKDLSGSCVCSPEIHIQRERRGLAACAAHPDGMKGLGAFSENREPLFKPM